MAERVPWHLPRHRPVAALLRRNWVAVVAVGLLGAASGLIEAGLLVLVVRVASVAAGDLVDVGAMSFGVLRLQDLSVGASFVLGGIGVVVMLLLDGGAVVVEAVVSRNEVTRARHKVADAYLHADWPTRTAEADGELVTLASSWTEQVRAALTHAVGLVVAAASFAAMLLVAVAVNPLAALAIAVVGGAFGAGMLPLTRFSRRYAGRMSGALTNYMGELSRMLRVQKEITTFDVAGPMTDRLAASASEHARWQAWSQASVKMVPVVYRVGMIAILFLGIGVVHAIDLENVSSLAAIVLILLRGLNYTRTVQSKVQALAETEPPLRLLAERLAVYELARRPRDGDELDQLVSLELRDVAFAYDEGPEVLAGLDLHLASGTVLGVVGPSGAGKSTLVDILVGLRQPTRGQVLVNDRPAEDLALGSRLAATALVPQEPNMLRGSIADNVTFLRDGIDRDEVVAALQRASLADLVAERGLDGEVGEHGTMLSGGQRQRLGIARALVARPAVLVLDEPTSALDVESERQVVEMLRTDGRERITIVISHRPAALEACDAVLVLQPDASHRLVARSMIDHLGAFLASAVGPEGSAQPDPVSRGSGVA